jgi:hypothetical protein
VTGVPTERTGMGMPGMGGVMGAPGLSGAGMDVRPNWRMVPRCTLKFEKITGGRKLTCTCCVLLNNTPVCSDCC